MKSAAKEVQFQCSHDRWSKRCNTCKQLARFSWCKGRRKSRTDEHQRKLRSVAVAGQHHHGSCTSAQALAPSRRQLPCRDPLADNGLSRLASGEGISAALECLRRPAYAWDPNRGTPQCAVGEVWNARAEPSRLSGSSKCLGGWAIDIAAGIGAPRSRRSLPAESSAAAASHQACCSARS